MTAANYRPPPTLYPFASNWLDRGGHRLHYLDEGPREAPPVLMVHGNPSWSFHFRHLVLALRRRFRCIVPDHLGCGLSDAPPEPDYGYRLADRVADLAALLEHLDLDRPLSLVMHDWGGMIGSAWAVRHPGSVDRLVILNTAAFPLPPGKRLPFTLHLAGRTRLGALLVRGAGAFSHGAMWTAFAHRPPRALRQAYTGPYDSWARRVATLRFVQDIPLTPDDPSWALVAETDEDLPRLADKPMLIAWGMRDFVFDEAFLDGWIQRFPDAEVQRYPECGHYVLEDAGPELVGRIARFLEGQ